VSKASGRLETLPGALDLGLGAAQIARDQRRGGRALALRPRTRAECGDVVRGGRGIRRRRGYDSGFVLSDHADWPDLLRTIRETGAKRVLCTHGYSEILSRYLMEQGLNASVLRTRYGGDEAED